jgi:hypothetical protein
MTSEERKKFTRSGKLKKGGCSSCQQKILDRRIERERLAKLNIKTEVEPCKECPPEK